MSLIKSMIFVRLFSLRVSSVFGYCKGGFVRMFRYFKQSWMICRMERPFHHWTHMGGRFSLTRKGWVAMECPILFLVTTTSCRRLRCEQRAICCVLHNCLNLVSGRYRIPIIFPHHAYFMSNVIGWYFSVIR